MPLAKSDQQTIMEARLLAGADTTEQLLTVLRALDSPTLAAEPPGPIDQVTIYAAALGQAQALCGFLADRCEALGAEVEDAETWAVWWVDEETGRAREVEHAPRKAAREMARSLNTPAPRGLHYVALPLGGLPSDDPDFPAAPGEVTR